MNTTAGHYRQSTINRTRKEEQRLYEWLERVLLLPLTGGDDDDDDDNLVLESSASSFSVPDLELGRELLSHTMDEATMDEAHY